MEPSPLEYVLRIAEEQEVRFVRLWFVDVLGLLKSCAIPVSELEQSLEDGVGIDGSSLESGARLVERDAIAHPDPATFELLPWRTGAAVTRMFCDIRLPDGTPYACDPREVLRRQLAAASARGYTLQVGPEIEFFLFAGAVGGGPPEPLDGGGYFDLTPLDVGSDFRRQTIEYLEQMGIPVKGSHHEVGASQHEMDLKHDDGLSTADAITTFRLAVKEVASELGVFASFMPKPLDDQPGSGMHLHLSLVRSSDGAAVFHDPRGEQLLSGAGRSFLAGVLAHAPELTAVTNQWVNSYKRLNTGFEAPTRVGWSSSSNGALVRVPANRPGRERAARIEVRSPDPACNPYLAVALLLAAGLRGIAEDYELPPELEGERAGGAALPQDLGEALDLFERSELVRETLGDTLCESFLDNKRREWHGYRTTVSEFERRPFSGLL